MMRSNTTAPVFGLGKARRRGFGEWRELWTYRELMYFLTWRDIKVRYKQTAIGVGWVLLQPLVLMLVFTLFFGRLVAVPSKGVPYPIFAYAALLPWQLFSRSLTEAASSLVKDQQLITRVYFPRILVPIAATLAALVDFAIASSILFVLMVFYGVSPGPSIIWLPAFCLLLVIATLGVAFWLSALNLQYRDVAYALPFLSQLWLFLTPVVYPSDLMPEGWRWVYALNPMTGVIEGFRWTLLGIDPGPTGTMAASVLAAVALFASGASWFRRRERAFADVVGSGGR